MRVVKRTGVSIMRCVATAVLALPILLGACASAGGGGASGRQDRITQSEIQGTEAQTAYDVIQELRPRWMVRNRGERSFAEGPADFPQVVVDDLPPRAFDVLKEIAREVIQEISFLSPREATFRYGTGYNAGIIKVATKH